jgi:hypothetical protein
MWYLWLVVKLKECSEHFQILEAASLQILRGYYHGRAFTLPADSKFFLHFVTISFISTKLFWFLTRFHYASISLYCDNRKDYYFVTESCFDCEAIKIAANVVTIYFGLNSEQYGTTLFFKKLSYSGSQDTFPRFWKRKVNIPRSFVAVYTRFLL